MNQIQELLTAYVINISLVLYIPCFSLHRYATWIKCTLSNRVCTFNWWQARIADER